MKIKMLTSIAGGDFSHAFGDVIDLPDAVAEAWVRAEIAEAVEVRRIEEAVVAAPENATLRTKRKVK